MHIYLKHPVHGAKIAIAEQEALGDEANGWVRYEPATSGEPTAPAPAPLESAPEEVNNLKRRRRSTE
jgi:hypothetical protein